MAFLAGGCDGKRAEGVEGKESVYKEEEIEGGCKEGRQRRKKENKQTEQERESQEEK